MVSTPDVRHSQGPGGDHTGCGDILMTIHSINYAKQLFICMEWTSHVYEGDRRSQSQLYGLYPFVTQIEPSQSMSLMK